MQFVYDLLNSVTPLSGEIKRFLEDRLEEEQIKRGQIIISAGTIARKMFFIQSGLIMSYYSKGFLKLACGFRKENEVALPVESFFSRRPAKENMIALEDSVLYCLHLEDVRELCQCYPLFNSCVCELIRGSHNINTESLRWFITLRPKQRYKHFVQTYPDLILRVPQKYIATYIGVAAETLSHYKGLFRRQQANKNCL